MSASALPMFETAGGNKWQPPVTGPIRGGQLTSEYVREIGRFAYLWAWPMVNIYNRRVVLDKVTGPGLSEGVVPVAPLNHLAMLRNSIGPEQQSIICPNRDVISGFGMFSLEREPVIVQVPEFGRRFWLYSVGDMRTDEFADLGTMYGSRPGLYLLVGPDWKGRVPTGIESTFRSTTNIGYIIPECVMGDTAEDREAARDAISQILMYPLSQYTGRMKRKDWRTVPSFSSPSKGRAETNWVIPETFFDVLPKVLYEAPPLPGEEAIYATVQAVLEAAQRSPNIQDLLTQTAIDAETNLVAPLFQFSSHGIPLAHHWTTIANGAKFGTDFFTRTAVAKSDIFVTRPQETKCFYLDCDMHGVRLHGSNRYAMKFASSELPPVKGFWSLALYNKQHFFSPNEWKRYSLGTMSKMLKYGSDGSLTLYAGSQPPDPDVISNWLPAPDDEFSLYLRAYWPDASILQGKWTPPSVVRLT